MLCDIDVQELENIDGGKAWYTWVGDVGVCVGTIALVCSPVGAGYAAAFAAASYLYAMNR